MYLKYWDASNTYWFDQNLADVQVSKEPVINERGLHTRDLHRWTIKGTLRGNTDSLITQMAALESAFDERRNIALYKDNQTTVAHHELLLADTISGVVPKVFSWAGGGNAEFATHRSFSINIEAETDFTGDYSPSASGYDMGFTETVSVVGTAGESWIFMPRFVGQADRFRTSEQTTCKIIQTGNAVGEYSYPLPKDPLFSSENEHLQSRNITRQAPEMTQPGVWRNYPISWNYEFEFNYEETATPNRG